VSKPRLERPVTTFERQWPWAGLAAFVGFLLVVMTLLFATGFLSKINDLRFGPNVRGYTATGILMGLLSLLFVFLTMWYSARKRRNVTGATMMTWLWAHVYFGLLAVLALVLRHVRPHPQFVVSLVTPTRPVSAAARAFIDMAAVDTH